jgi:sec-independent protein translocase protein TatC
MPVVIFFLTKLGLVTTAFLKKNRKYALLLIFVVSAILTPPDVITQCMMAVPLLTLYEVGILVSRFARRAKKNEDEDEKTS